MSVCLFVIINENASGLIMMMYFWRHDTLSVLWYHCPGHLNVKVKKCIKTHQTKYQQCTEDAATIVNNCTSNICLHCGSRSFSVRLHLQVLILYFWLVIFIFICMTNYCLRIIYFSSSWLHVLAIEKKTKRKERQDFWTNSNSSMLTWCWRSTCTLW